MVGVGEFESRRVRESESRRVGESESRRVGESESGEFRFNALFALEIRSRAQCLAEIYSVIDYICGLDIRHTVSGNRFAGRTNLIWTLRSLLSTNRAQLER